MDKTERNQTTLDLMTVEQACELLNVKKSKMRSMLFRNEIPVIRIGKCLRFCRKDLDQWLEEKKSYSFAS